MSNPILIFNFSLPHLLSFLFSSLASAGLIFRTFQVRALGCGKCDFHRCPFTFPASGEPPVRRIAAMDVISLRYRSAFFATFTCYKRKKVRALGFEPRSAGIFYHTPFKACDRVRCRTHGFTGHRSSHSSSTRPSPHHRADPLPIIHVTGAREDARLPYAPTPLLLC